MSDQPQGWERPDHEGQGWATHSDGAAAAPNLDNWLSGAGPGGAPAPDGQAAGAGTEPQQFGTPVPPTAWPVGPQPSGPAQYPQVPQYGQAQYDQAQSGQAQYGPGPHYGQLPQYTSAPHYNQNPYTQPPYGQAPFSPPGYGPSYGPTGYGAGAGPWNGAPLAAKMPKPKTLEWGNGLIVAGGGLQLASLIILLSQRTSWINDVSQAGNYTVDPVKSFAGLAVVMGFSVAVWVGMAIASWPGRQWPRVVGTVLLALDLLLALGFWGMANQYGNGPATLDAVLTLIPCAAGVPSLICLWNQRTTDYVKWRRAVRRQLPY